MRDQIVNKNKCGTTGRVEEHFLRHVQGLGWRGGRRKGCLEDRRRQKPQKMHLQGSDGTNTDGEWLDGVRRDPFPTPTIPSGAQGGDLQFLSKHRRENLSHASPTWPSHLILSRISLRAPSHLRVFSSLTVSMMTISAIRPPSQLLLLLLPKLVMLLLVLPTHLLLDPGF